MPSIVLDSRVDPNAILRLVRPVDGWLWEGEIVALASLAVSASSEHPEAQIVEVGSYLGRSTVSLAAGVRASGSSLTKVHAVDPHEGELGPPVGNVEPTWDRFVENVENQGMSNFVVPVRARSTEVVWTDPISMLFVDGQHDELSVRRDFEHFEPWIVDDGVACFHDWRRWPGVTSLVTELSSVSWDLVGVVDSLAVLRRV